MWSEQRRLFRLIREQAALLDLMEIGRQAQALTRANRYWMALAVGCTDAEATAFANAEPNDPDTIEGRWHASSVDEAVAAAVRCRELIAMGRELHAASAALRKDLNALPGRRRTPEHRELQRCFDLLDCTTVTTLAKVESVLGQMQAYISGD